MDVHVGGGTDNQICIEQTRKVSFFLVKTSSFDHANRALEWMIQCVVFVVGPLLPYIHLAYTWHHSCAKWDQAFPVFHCVFHFCIALNANQTTKNEGGLGSRLGLHFLSSQALYKNIANEVQLLFLPKRGWNFDIVMYSWMKSENIHALGWTSGQCFVLNLEYTKAMWMSAFALQTKFPIYVSWESDQS